VVAKAGDSTRRLDGFVWLARHSRRRDIVAYVRGGRDAAPEWLKADRVFAKVKRDRAVWQAAHPADGRTPSLREVADAVAASGFKVSHQTVDNILTAYADLSGPKPAQDVDRRRLKWVARRVITREVVAAFDAGQMTLADVAALIGHNADQRNAAYWVGRMRTKYQQTDAPAPRTRAG
jgi:hypothetical protein